MGEERVEYRVVWQRDGMARRTALYQTHRGATEKVKALLWSDRVKSEGADSDDYHSRHLAEMPDLAAAPTIEARSVGEWTPLSTDEEERG